ncbi:MULTISPECIES: nitrate- and nitrite sensing domain-containing protein [unclassified Phaeobacter]|uniref:nitrate- and nitrite sensing domain-containing protein n=1 Tax=unclassified Phaeobacter TaxID=2621772 RepID=UPI003A887D09
MEIEMIHVLVVYGKRIIPIIVPTVSHRIGEIMPLRLAILLVVAPLFLLAGYLAASALVAQRARHLLAEYAAQTAKEESAISDMIHELQRERGYSVGYVSSDGRVFPDALIRQRGQTDAVVASALSRITLMADDHSLAFDRVVHGVERLAELRQHVDGLGFDRPVIVSDVAGPYTELISTIMALTRQSVGLDSSTEYQALRQARFLIGEAKEKAGLERATGAAVIETGNSSALREHFAALGGAQIILLTEAAVVKGSGSWLPSLQRTDQYLTLSDLRDTIRSAKAASGPAALNSERWVAASTEWIDFLRREETNVTAEIISLANQLEAESTTELVGLIWLTIFAGIAGTLFVVLTLK